MFIGRIDGADFESFIGDDEQCLDEADDIRAIPLQGQTRRGRPKGGKPDLKDLDEDELKDEITSGRSPFHASARLLWLWALEEIPKTDAQAELEAIFDSIKQGDRGPKWKAHRAAIPQWVDRMYGRAAKHLGTFPARLVAYFEEDALWRGAIRHKLFTQTIEVCDPFPPLPGHVFETYRPLRRSICSRPYDRPGQGFPKVSLSDLWRAII
jgi:hypothetical protein